ncbi:hypothetical protein Bhyg_00887 [Pseudolycoriella hygida]|uniref:Uncharacterized protein n=1 Tax=Pseudolycoriella hygida TaxID=35572 RepID=A0A9Q0NAE4_9DIPT|nr:hypothetical protein Bhyg_00887 [Pseudolycoriella hygida]
MNSEVMANVCLLLAVTLLCTAVVKCQECSGKPRLPPHKECCKITLPPQQEQCIQQIKEQWKAFHQSQDKENFAKSDMCMANCVLNDDNVVTPDNKINSDEVRNMLSKLLGAEWQSLIPSMIDTCKNRVDNFNHNFNGTHGPHGGHGPHGHGKGPHHMSNCNKKKEMLSFCLGEQYTLNCPDSLWQNDDDCNEMRNYLKTCPFEKRGPRRHS